MRTLLSEQFAPITTAIGFVELPLGEVAAGFEAWQRTLDSTLRATKPVAEFPEVLHLLEPLTGGIRPRRLFVAAGLRWTAYFDCGLRGTDAVSTIGHMARTLRCQGLAIRCTPHMVGRPGVINGRAGSVQFELFGPLETDFINYVRTVSVTSNGTTWRFDEHGVVQAFEETQAYTRRSVRERFTSHMLERYCQAIDINVFDPDFYGPQSVLFETDVAPAPGGYVMSLEQAQQWLEIHPGVADSLPG